MMSNHKRVFQGRFRLQAAAPLLLLIAILSTGCGGGGSSSNDNKSSNTTNTDQLILAADAGAICETLLQGEVYTRATVPLVCNNGSDPFKAYLDGSGSTTSGDDELRYTWSFVYKPSGSNAKLVGANTVNPTFMPDVAGPYAVQLVIKSNGVSSQRAVALVVALDDATLFPNYVATPTAPQYIFHGGLSNNCSGCHSGNSSSPRAKSSAHIATSNLCQTCHSPKGFIKASFVDHAEVFGNCSDCHNGVIAIGKSAAHIDTAQECSDCHTTDSFLPLNPDGTFDHTNATLPCSACHNGIVALGTDSAPNPPGHPSVSVECNNCHTTATFTTPFVNHSAVTPGSCGQVGCHDGLSPTITSKNSAPYTHPDTGNITEACDLCHNTTTFDLAGLFDHDLLARHPIACKSCHDGFNATGMNVGHTVISPSADCSNCHQTSSFTGGFVDHTSTEVTSKQCTDCHNGTDAPGAPVSPPALDDIHTAAALAGQTCDDCHTAGGSFDLATVDHSSFDAMTDCSACHDGITARGKSDTHLDTTAQCSVCHDSQSDTFAGGTFDHSTAVTIVGTVSTPSCTSCHNGTTAIGRSLTHVPLPMPGEDCLVCHDTGFTSFAQQTFDHTAAGITDNCASCHDGLPHDGVVVISAPTSHIPTTDDCSTCHTETLNGPGINGTSSSGFTNADRFVNTVHPAYSTGCSTCHNGSYDNAVYGATFYSAPVSSTHNTANSAGWDCNACHSTTGGFTEIDPVNHKDPTIKAQQCVSCHADGNTAQPIGRIAGHPPSSDTCQDCHQAGGSFIAGFDHATLDAGGANEGMACIGCHNGLTATGKSTNHLPTTRDCSVCHAGYPPAVPSFAGGSFDHSGPEMLGKQCVDCHNNDVAIGKSDAHLVTNADCGACHTTEGTFATNATGGFNHTGVVTGCADSGCHAAGTSGVVDVTDDPNPLPHIPIIGASGEINCYSCHRNAGGTFANASMDHSVVTSTSCESCHDGSHDGSNTTHVVTPKPSDHFVTSVTACASCHTSTSSWASIDYNHVANAGYPGDHSTRRITSCVQCHDSSPPDADISGFPHATYGSTCAACHASDGTREHGNPLGSRYYNCGSCHRVSSSSW